VGPIDDIQISTGLLVTVPADAGLRVAYLRHGPATSSSP
jgi:hypothetical protein